MLAEKKPFLPLGNRLPELDVLPADLAGVAGQALRGQAEPDVADRLAGVPDGHLIRPTGSKPAVA
jgi:hypothetical protein